jgi:integrase
MRENGAAEKVAKPGKKRSPTRYWREMKGRLYARLQYRGEGGRWREKLKPIPDKRSARAVVESMRRELEERGPQALHNETATFAQLAAVFRKAKMIPAVYANKVKVAGRKSNVNWAYDSLLDYFGQRKLCSILPRDLEAYKLHRLEGITQRGTKRNIATVNRELSLMRSMLSFAVQNEYLAQNPFSRARGVIMSSAETERDRILSFDEEVRLLNMCTDRRAHLRPILICALDTGMRAGEMFKMRWRDIIEWREIRIPQTNTKTEESRVVGMTPRLRAEVQQLWEVSAKDPDGLVFGIGDSVKRSWKTACRLAGVEGFRLHDCRHTATTRMIASGSPHTEVMKITGHSQLKTFLRYLNITREAADRVADRLDRYLMSNRSQVHQVSEGVN